MEVLNFSSTNDLNGKSVYLSIIRLYILLLRISVINFLIVRCAICTFIDPLKAPI